MDNRFVQLIPIEPHGGGDPYAFYGLTADGYIWYSAVQLKEDQPHKLDWYLVGSDRH